MNDRKYFLIFCILSIVLVGIIFGINGIMRGTSASFGGVTGVLGDPYKVIYYANWPDKSMGDDSTEYNVGKIYQILDNMYAVPSGYEFLGWGTEPDGSVVYNAFHVLSLSSDLNLYAIWGLVDTDEDDNNTEEFVIVYGDTNIDGIVNENDYLLIDSYILDNSLLSGQGLINADVNTDGKVDNIDSDIIKQVCLGTEGYVGFLPDKPILIYELYVKDDSNGGDVPTEDDNGNNNSSSNENGSSSSSGGGTGSGSTGSSGGNSSSGNSTGGNKPSGGSSNNGNNKPSSSQGGKEEDNKEEEELPKIYEFKFMNGNMEYAITSCDILQDGTCKLILPNTIPSKVGYVFNGWSLSKDCISNIIKDSMDVNAGGTYYACYIEIANEKEEKNSFNIWIILFGVWALASILIYRIVKQFKNKEIN